MGVRAFYEQENNFGVTDRIEINDPDFSDTPIQFDGRFPLAFDFNHRETTSEQRDYLSIFENQIIMGVMDLYLRIDSPEKETFLEDIADASTKTFQLVWKRDGDPVWYGYPYGRVVEYNDRPQYNYKIQFRDFEFLKGLDYDLDDTRQLLFRSILDIWNELSIPLDGENLVKTATSWQEENNISNDDFLNLIYNDTYPLRDYASDGYSTDQVISYYEAFHRIAEPMLICYQWKGLNVYQISALKDPSDVDIATYGLAGQISYESVDLRQQIYTSVDEGLPTSKVSAQNSSYPAIRKVFYEFNHRSGSSRFEFDTTGDFPPVVDFDESDHYISTKEFTGNGDERLNFLASYSTTNEDLFGTFAVSIDEYALDSDYEFKTAENHTGYASNGTSSVNTSNGRLNLFADEYTIGDPVMLYTDGVLPTGFVSDSVYYIVDKNDADDWIQLSESPGGSVIVPSDSGTDSVYVRVIKIEENTEPYSGGYRAIISFISGEIPAISDSEMQVILIKTGASTDSERWNEPNIFIENPTAAGESLEYRLTQDQLYPESFEMNDSYYGDGPYPFSKSSYRFSLSLGDITTGWRRRGESSYEPYSRLRLREVLDYQRVRQQKKTFHLWGEFDPSKVSVFQSDNFMYVGGAYNGRWHPITVRINEVLDV